MNVPQASILIDSWSRGTGRSTTERALLLLELALPALDEEQRAHLSIGYRDAWLLSLRELLFGSAIECVAACPDCEEEIAVDFTIGEVRTSYAEPGEIVTVEAEGGALRLRLPDSADLLAIEQERDAGTAGPRLLERCLAGAADRAALGTIAFEAVSRALGEADPQAELRLRIACPACGGGTEAPFDVAAHLWSDLDEWVGAQLLDVHCLASRYGWSEAEILAMSPARRRVYLDRFQGATG
ncbi:MAG: hypothetical protein ACJ8EB_05600 [Allosphingosinicella sp.]